MRDKLATVGDSLDYISNQFAKNNLYFGHGTDNAGDEAAWLICHCLNLDFAELANVLTMPLDDSQKKQILAIAEQRIATRKPLAYLIHEAWFAGLKFYVNDKVLIPRSPVAEIIAQQFQPWLQPEQINSILDIGTGSGCIAIACAKALPHAQVDAADIDADALAIAKHNCQQHQVNINLFQSDVFANIPAQRYDVIISNPPYVDQADMDALPTEYRHEPAHALAAGTDGLDIVDSILRDASQFLTEHGILIVEVGNSEVALAAKYPHLPFTWLDFEYGGGGVFLLTRQQLIKTYFQA